MDSLVPIDRSTWARSETYDHFRDAVPCTVALTFEIDVTEAQARRRAARRKAYLAQIWAIAHAVNGRSEFRMALGGEGEPAVWSTVHPSFTVFNAERETFSNLWCPYSPDFATFHAQASELMEEHSAPTALFPQAERPANLFDVSSLPWRRFTGMVLDVEGGRDHLLPIFTIGRCEEREGRLVAPLAIQVSHAAADGFHLCRLADDIQALAADPGWM
ncbi:CatA-like O-acetyltransferase [Demequina sp. NBRC 110057]|uniref:CatA-like O-acetyltransferase n=1 Tax=Demequina sp. NBRC 110057 TaxID=1570346 RepID=UPI000A0683AC|nr:CatA-like O-acetyltransferase [Demequina sp. NBRC 110057]